MQAALELIDSPVIVLISLKICLCAILANAASNRAMYSQKMMNKQ